MILGIVQARMSSTRMPGKVLMPLGGQPMLARQIERLCRAARMDRLMIATTVQPDDEPVAALAVQLGVESYRGSSEDVLDRFFRAAEPRRPSHVVRLTADCPLADWRLIDRAIERALSGDFDYVSTALHQTWPDGLDAEVLTFAALEAAWTEARSPVEREHVTPFVINDPGRFSQCSVDSPIDLSAVRWTVDEPRDFELVSRVYDLLYPANPAFTTEDILALLSQKPELMKINQGIERNEGLRRSIERFMREFSSD